MDGVEDREIAAQRIRADAYVGPGRSHHTHVVSVRRDRPDRECARRMPGRQCHVRALGSTNISSGATGCTIQALDAYNDDTKRRHCQGYSSHSRMLAQSMGPAPQCTCDTSRASAARSAVRRKGGPGNSPGGTVRPLRHRRPPRLFGVDGPDVTIVRHHATATDERIEAATLTSSTDEVVPSHTITVSAARCARWAFGGKSSPILRQMKFVGLQS